jgi:hypothetical protein
MMLSPRQSWKKKLLLFLSLVATGFILSPPLKAQFIQSLTPHLYGANQTIRIDPRPELGFYYPYYLFIPDNTRTDAAVHMLVEPNNTGRKTDDFTVHEQKAKSALEMRYPNRIACRMGIPLLMPVFPRLISHPLLFTHSLDRDSLLIREEQLRRVDLQLIAMIDHARKLLREKGLIIHDKVLLHGFSASGKFVNRFTLMHPDYVKAAACGGMNSTPMLPLAKADGEKLIYPVGVYDLQELTGSRFRFRKYKKVPQYIYQGRLDINDTLQAPECFGAEEVRLIKKVLHEKMMPERWEAAKHWYKKAGITAQFVIYDETCHEVKDEIIDDVVRFFQANMGEKFVPIQPFVYSPVAGIQKAHIKEILLPGSPRISAFFAKTMDCHFFISIAEWIRGQDYSQLDRFVSYAGFSFEIIDAASGKAIGEIHEKNCVGKISSGKGDFQGYKVRLNKKQLQVLDEGKTYTLRPIVRSDTYQWLIEKEISFVWRDLKEPAVLEELKVLGAYWEGNAYLQGLRPEKRNSIFLETDSFSLSSIDAFFDKAGWVFELINDEKPRITVIIYKGGLYHTENGKELYGFWATIPEEEFSWIEPGVSYKVAPRRRGTEYKWIIGADLSLTRSK